MLLDLREDMDWEVQYASNELSTPDSFGPWELLTSRPVDFETELVK